MAAMPEMQEIATTEGLPLFQAKPAGPRGALSFANNEYLISLFERADLSTLLHETGHLFFAEMESLMKADPDMIISDCGSCKMQISNFVDTPVMDPIQVRYEALGIRSSAPEMLEA